MANIEENRKLMVEQIARAKAELSEAKKLKPKDTKGLRILQAIKNNYPLVDVKNRRRHGELKDKESIIKTAEAALPIIKNGITAALKHNYELHPDIVDNPTDTHKDYWRFDTKKDMQDTLDRTIGGLKELLGLVEKAIQKPSATSLQRVADLGHELLNVDAGHRGYLGARILSGQKDKSSII